MAFAIVNSTSTPRVVRGEPIPLGTLTALNAAVQFAVPVIRDIGLKRLVITLDGNLAGTAVTYLLEASLDGVRWFVVPPIGSDITVAGTADTAAVAALRYDTSGLGGMIFRFGVNGGSAITGSSQVWVQVD